MATELAKAYVQIVPVSEGAASGVEKIFNGSDVTQATTKSGKNIGGTLAKAAAAGITAAAATVTAAAASLWSGVNATAEVGDNIDKTSQKLGVTAEQYQTMAYAAEHCGFSTQVLNTAQKTLSSSDFNGSIYDAIGYIQSLGTEEERTAAAAELFGTKAAQQMQPLINGTETIDEYSQSLSDIGGMMSGETVSASAAFEDSLTDLTTAISGAKNGIMAEFLPGCTEVMNGLTMLFSGQDGATEMIAQGLTDFSTQLSAAIPQIVATFSELLPALLEAGVQIISSLAEGILSAIPNLMPAVSQIIVELANNIILMLPQLLTLGVQIIASLVTGIAQALPNLIPTAVNVITSMVQSLVDNIPLLIDCALQLIEGLTQGLLDAIPQLIESLPEIINSLVNGLLDSIPQIIECGIRLLVSLVDALPEIIDAIVEALPEIITGIVTGLLDHLDEIILAGVELFIALVSNMPKIIVEIVKAIPKIIVGIVNGFKEAWPQIKQAGIDLLINVKEGLSDAIPKLMDQVTAISDSIRQWFSNGFDKIKDIGANIITGLWNGINDKVQWLKDKISSFTTSVLDSIKDFFGIHSPSKVMADEVGKFLPEGLAVGIDANADSAINAMNDLNSKMLNTTTGLSSYEVSNSNSQSNLEEMVYEAFSKALDNHKINFNNRELGRLVREYA